MTKAQGKAVELQKEIEAACIKHGLNLTIYDGKNRLCRPDGQKNSYAVETNL